MAGSLMVHPGDEVFVSEEFLLNSMCDVQSNVYLSLPSQLLPPGAR